MEKNKTAVEWLADKVTDMIHESNHIELVSLLEQAKQMENVEIIKRTLDGAEDTADYVDKVIIKALVEDMHKQPLTFVSKEISDEEITKQGFLHSYLNELPDENAISFIQGAKWYREQLKRK